MMKKALMLTWQGYQDNEVLYPMYRLQEDDFVVDILAETKGFIHGILGTKVKATFESKDLTDGHVNEYDFLVIPGGVKALEKLRQQNLVSCPHYDHMGKWLKTALDIYDSKCF